MENLPELLTALISLLISAIIRFIEKRKLESELKNRIDNASLLSGEKDLINKEIQKTFWG
jgi:hypothetical protein